MLASLYQESNEIKRNIIIDGLTVCDLSSEDVDTILEMGVVKLVIQIWPNASTALKNKLIKGFQKAKLSEDAIESIADNCGISTAVQLLQSTLPTTIKSTIHKLKTMNCIIYIFIYYNIYRVSN